MRAIRMTCRNQKSMQKHILPFNQMWITAICHCKKCIELSAYLSAQLELKGQGNVQVKAVPYRPLLAAQQGHL